jgi:hypothetical protein
MKLKILLNTICLILLTGQLAAQSIYRKSYTGLTNIASIEPVADGGYILCGTDNQNTGATNLSMVKTDGRGTVQWSMTYGDGNISETGKKVVATPEGGFLAIGTAAANYTYPFVVKTSSTGEVIWAKYFQSLSSVNPTQTINDVVPMPDSGYVFAGSSANNYSFLMRIDKDGNIMWSNCHLSTAVIFNRIIRLTNGEFLATGSRGNVFFVAHLDASGNLLAGRTYSAMGTEGHDIYPTADGNFAFAGKTASAFTMMKTDLAGNVYWAKSYNTSAPFFPSVRELPSGNFIASLYGNSYGDIILTVDNIGNSPSARYHSGGANTFSDRMKMSHDGNLIRTSGNQVVKFNSTSPFTCSSTAVTFTATGLSPAPITQTVTYNIVGLPVTPNYYSNSIPVTVASTCGGKCTTTDNFTASINAPDTVCMGKQVTLSYAGSGTVSTYTWTENGVNFSTSASPTRYFNVPGSQQIRLLITNSSNCRDTTTKTIFVRNNCGVNGNPMNYFTKTLSNYNTSADIQTTSDNGFVLSGSTTLPGTPDMCLIKTDSNAVVQWSRSYGSGSLNEYGSRVRETNDGGFLIVGDENYVFAVKTSSNGTLEWQNNYQLITGTTSTTSQVVKDVIITPDNGAIIIGSAATNYAMLFKIDSNGNVVWANHSLATGATSFNDITSLSNGNYLITGTNGTTPFVVEINGSGTIQWSKQYTQLNGAEHVIELSDGNRMLIGRNSTTRIGLVKLDPAGNVIWAKYTTSIGTITGLGGVEDPDGGIITTCYATSYGLVAIKFNHLGNVVESRYYSGTDNPARVVKTASGAYVFSDGSSVRKFSAFNQIASCNSTAVTLTSTAVSPVPSVINLTPNSYAMVNNQFYVATNTIHTVTTPCTNTGCNTIAQFISSPNACTNEVVTFTNTSLGGVTYTWNENNVPFDNSFNTTRTFSAPGTYVIRLDVVGPNGCTSNFTININVGSTFTATVSPDVSIPCGGNTQLTATGGTTYIWSPATGLSDPFIANPVASPNNTTTYTVTIGNGGNCFINRTVTVTVSGAPNIAITGTNSICPGSSTTLTASGATSYSWQPGGQTGSSITVSPSTTTTYTVTGSNGSCSGTQSVTVTVNPNPVISAGSNVTICEGDAVMLTATGANTYVWQPGNLSGSSVNVNPVVTTTYTVTGTDSNGCTGTSGVTITVNSIPSVTYNEVLTLVCENYSPFALTPATPSGGVYSGPGVTGNMFDPGQAGVGTWNVIYSYTDGNGCTGMDTSQITVDLCSGISTPSSYQSIQVTPNPFKQQFRIVTDLLIDRLAIYDMAGKLIVSFTGVVNPEIDGSFLGSGIYIVKAETAEGIKYIKVVRD